MIGIYGYSKVSIMNPFKEGATKSLDQVGPSAISGKRMKGTVLKGWRQGVTGLVQKPIQSSKLARKSWQTYDLTASR